MPAAVNGNEFHFNLRVVAPEYLLDVKSVNHLGLARFGRADDVVEVKPKRDGVKIRTKTGYFAR